MFRANTLQPMSKLRLCCLHAVVKQVFLRVMHSIRIDRHIAHDVMNHFVVGSFTITNVVDLVGEQVQHSSHVAVVLPKVLEQVRQKNCHIRAPFRVPRSDRA